MNRTSCFDRFFSRTAPMTLLPMGRSQHLFATTRDRTNADNATSAAAEHVQRRSYRTNYRTPQQQYRSGSGHHDRLTRSSRGADYDYLRKVAQNQQGGKVGEAEYIQQRFQQEKFRNSLDSFADDLYMGRAFQYKRQKAIVESEGIEAAIRDSLTPNANSFDRQLEHLPLDPKVLEEIHRDGHGKRFNRPLRKGLHFERWVAHDPANASVQTASVRAKEAFGFGGAMELLASAASPQQFPVSKISEIAFVGATNSGRSSLLNAISNSFLCDVSDLPGTTRNANFYSLSGKLLLVDLPGYGYYNPVEATRTDAEGAVQVLDTYLQFASVQNRGRRVKRFYVCVSARQPLHDADYNMFERLQQNGCPFCVILTKTDLVPITRLARMTTYFRQQLAAYDHCVQIMLVSSLRLCGVQRVQSELANFALSHHSANHMVDTDFSDLV